MNHSPENANIWTEITHVYITSKLELVWSTAIYILIYNCNQGKTVVWATIKWAWLGTERIQASVTSSVDHINTIGAVWLSGISYNQYINTITTGTGHLHVLESWIRIHICILNSLLGAGGMGKHEKQHAYWDHEVDRWDKQMWHQTHMCILKITEGARHEFTSKS